MSTGLWKQFVNAVLWIRCLNHTPTCRHICEPQHSMSLQKEDVHRLSDGNFREWLQAWPCRCCRGARWESLYLMCTCEPIEFFFGYDEYCVLASLVKPLHTLQICEACWTASRFSLAHLTIGMTSDHSPAFVCKHLFWIWARARPEKQGTERRIGKAISCPLYYLHCLFPFGGPTNILVSPRNHSRTQ